MKKLVISALVVFAIMAFAVSVYAGGSKETTRVAFLLPENVTPRWEGSDAPTFKQALEKLIPGVQIDVLNALKTTRTSSSRKPRPS